VPGEEDWWKFDGGWRVSLTWPTKLIATVVASPRRQSFGRSHDQDHGLRRRW